MISIRWIYSAVRISSNKFVNLNQSALSTSKPWSALSAINCKDYSTTLLGNVHQRQDTPSLLANPTLIQISNDINTRNLIKYSMGKGKRRSVKAVTDRFFRLRWGGWIRTIAGRFRRQYRKRPARKIRVQQHVLCNATQSRLLDKMVTSYWRRPKYYVDDPYEPYHVREEFQFTARKPKPYFPPEDCK